MAEYENVIEINGLTVKYDGFTLDNVSFCVLKGSIMGFIGQNDAGKTTTIKSLLNGFFLILLCIQLLLRGLEYPFIVRFGSKNGGSL